MSINRFDMGGSSDGLGMVLSVICLLHCVALPPLLAVLPLFAVSVGPEWLHASEWLHAALLVPVFLVSGPTLIRGAQLRRSIGVAAVVAFSVMTLALFVPESWQEVSLTVFGATTLFVAHLTNLKLRKLT